MQELRSVKNNESLTDDDDINRFDEEGDLEKWNQHESQDAERKDGDIYHQVVPAESTAWEIK